MSLVTPPMQMKWLYTLKLEKMKFYVGITWDIEKRLEEHKNGTASEWTKRYKVIGIMDQEEVPTDEAQSRESTKTFEMMLKFGVNNVRGAGLCQVNSFTELDIPMLTGIIGHQLGADYKKLSERLGGLLNFCYIDDVERVLDDKDKLLAIQQERIDSQIADIYRLRIQVENLEIKYKQSESQHTRQRENIIKMFKYGSKNRTSSFKNRSFNGAPGSIEYFLGNSQSLGDFCILSDDTYSTDKFYLYICDLLKITDTREDKIIENSISKLTDRLNEVYESLKEYLLLASIGIQ